jgi:hypothetical protein
MDRYTTRIIKIDGMPTPQELEAWLFRHPAALLASVIACLWISLTLIFRIWSIHRADSMVKKTIWSLILFIPFVGWIFYGGFYNPPACNENRPPPPTDKDS